MQFIWAPSHETFGYETTIFTHAMHHIYASPPGFDVDERKPFDLIIDNPKLDTYNVEQKKQQWVDWIDEIRPIYNLTDHMFIQMGGDFEYSNAALNFGNMDRLIKMINSDPELNMNVFYSTPSRYVEAVNSQKFTQWPWKTDDMFPYASSANEFWSGYFTSRSNSKMNAREASRKLRAYSQILASEVLGHKNKRDDVVEALNDLNDAISVHQHHDAITGTDRQHVADDYSLRLFKASKAAERQVSDHLNTKYAPIFGDIQGKSNWQECLVTNGTRALDCGFFDNAKELEVFYVSAHVVNGMEND